MWPIEYRCILSANKSIHREKRPSVQKKTRSRPYSRKAGCSFEWTHAIEHHCSQLHREPTNHLWSTLMLGECRVSMYRHIALSSAGAQTIQYAFRAPLFSSVLGRIDRSTFVVFHGLFGRCVSVCACAPDNSTHERNSDCILFSRHFLSVLFFCRSLSLFIPIVGMHTKTHSIFPIKSKWTAWLAHMHSDPFGMIRTRRTYANERIE